MKRVCVIVLDGVGVGELPDAAQYGDQGANTLGHVMESVHPSLPNMEALGLGYIGGSHAPRAACVRGGYGKAAEASAGKDTTTGHWEMMGIRLAKACPTFPQGFPKALMDAFEQAIGRKTLGNYAASGTAILDQLGAEHLRTGCPIVYTSADSVFQIACHEDVYSPEKLYAMCETARGLLQGPWGVGRVIARPFIGQPGCFTRTPRRRDFSLEPTGQTLLDDVKAAGLDCLGVGKIEDIFCHRGLTGSNHAAGNPACLAALAGYLGENRRGLIFANLVDYDMAYGHRNDVAGFAGALEAFDGYLPELQALLTPEDLLIITADHGCDPTFPGTDHTREYIPILCWSPAMKGGVDLGVRATYADIAATAAEALGLPQRYGAQSFYPALQAIL